MIERTKHAGTNYRMVKPFIEQVMKSGGSVRFKSDGYMNLSLEYLEYSDSYGNPVYSMAHYGEQNGDLMSDPEMTFSVNNAAETIIPYSWRNDYIGKDDYILKEIHGKTMYSRSMLKSLDDFMNLWLRNIHDQGFTPENFEVI